MQNAAWTHEIKRVFSPGVFIAADAGARAASQGKV